MCGFGYSIVSKITHLGADKQRMSQQPTGCQRVIDKQRVILEISIRR
jgi:hypothetical protein